VQDKALFDTAISRTGRVQCLLPRSGTFLDLGSASFGGEVDHIAVRGEQVLAARQRRLEILTDPALRTSTSDVLETTPLLRLDRMSLRNGRTDPWLVRVGRADKVRAVAHAPRGGAVLALSSRCVVVDAPAPGDGCADQDRLRALSTHDPDPRLIAASTDYPLPADGTQSRIEVAAPATETELVFLGVGEGVRWFDAGARTYGPLICVGGGSVTALCVRPDGTQLALRRESRGADGASKVSCRAELWVSDGPTWALAASCREAGQGTWDWRPFAFDFERRLLFANDALNELAVHSMVDGNCGEPVKWHDHSGTTVRAASVAVSPAGRLATLSASGLLMVHEQDGRVAVSHRLPIANTMFDGSKDSLSAPRLSWHGEALGIARSGIDYDAPLVLDGRLDGEARP
jgi:hypothetical protein